MSIPPGRPVVEEGQQGPVVGSPDQGAAAPFVYGLVESDELARSAVAQSPTNNMGVRDTVRVFLDWLAFTVPAGSCATANDVMAWLTPSEASLTDWVMLDHGGLGYRSCVQRGNVRVYFDGAVGMGVHVVLSGKAMRQAEEEFGLFTESAWLSWLFLMRERGCRFTRIDPAMDDVGPDGVLDMAVIIDAARSKHLVSLFRSCRHVTSNTWELSEGGDNVAEGGETLYFGSRSSDMFVRIYNKAAQLGESFHHIRVEIEAKDKNAEEMVTRLIEGGFSQVPRVLRAYIDFKTPSSDSNKARWDTAPWWDTFLAGCEKARFSVAKRAKKALDDVKGWLKRQAAQSVAMVFDAIEKECKAAGLDARKAHRKYIYTLVEEGRSRYKTKHRVLLGGYVPSLEGGLSL